MKNITINLFIISFILAPLHTLAQDTPVKERKINNELGVNASFFLKELINFTNNFIIPVSPYVFTYKHYAGNGAFRMGLGGNYSTGTETSSGLPGERTQKAGKADVRMGYEYRGQIGKKWMITAGGDVVWNYENSSVVFDSGFDRVTTSGKTNLFGGGPLVGIQFWLHKRIALSTEAAIYFTAGSTKTSDRFETFPEFNSNTKTKMTNLDFVLPTSIFFSFSF